MKYRIVVPIIGAIILAVAFAFVISKRSYERTIVALQNEIAKRDSTIEVQKNVYTKLAMQVDDLKSSLDMSTEEGKRLADELKKSKSDLLTVTNVLAKLKEQIATGSGTQTQPVPGRLRVDFEKDFGVVSISGYTVTNPPEYQLKLNQGSKPLKMTLAIAQQKDGSWKTFVTSSDENIAFDIGVSAVNPTILEPNWYEKFSLRLDLGVGDGVLTGISAAYSFGKFDIGPSIWGMTVDGGHVFYGGSIAWHPFKR